jgi:hypothetical protein
MGMIVFDPEALRAGAVRLMSLASTLRSVPESRGAVLADVVAQLRDLAGARTSATQAALATAADSFESSPEVTPEAIEEFAGRLNAVADNQAAAIASVNALTF